MIRTTLLLLLVAFFSAYAWKDWFVSLCMAILLMAVVQHPDFPGNIAGVQGLNPWNFLILNVMLAWYRYRASEGEAWDMPPLASRLWLGFLLVILVGVVRLLVSDYPEVGFTTGMVFSEYLINTVKWVIPGLLLFDACRTRQRAAISLGVILSLYFLLGLQVVRWMPLSEMGGSADMASRASKLIQNEIGYNRVTLSMMLAGASWSTLAALPLLRKNTHRLILLAAGVTIILGQALTGGRTGYVTWVAIGIALAGLRWRKLLLILPVGLAIIATTMPSVRDRMLQGVGGKEGNFKVGTSAYEMTSGRDIAWPVVIDKIAKAPLMGYGRQGMVTSGARDFLMINYNESFPHPHQAYLEQLLDNGLTGFLIVIPLFLLMFFRSVPLVLERNDPLVCAVGCAGFCMISALMIGAFGGQTFYPREGAVGMWAAMGLVLRVSVQRKNWLETGEPLFPDFLPAQYFVAGASEEAEVFAAEYAS